jgi:transcriptional regulator with XRE-family HTH domain
MMHHIGNMNFEKAGSLIRIARREAGLTQAILAKRLRMSRATISQLETGVITELGVRKLSRVCDLLGLEVSVHRRQGPPTLQEAYAANEKERQSMFKETDAALAKLDKGSV